jgi:hypothetical protein
MDLIMKRPLNWVDIPGVRLEELQYSHFLLLEDIVPGNPARGLSVWSWLPEVERFKQNAYSELGPDKDGLERVSDGAVKLLCVADESKFSEARYAWAKSINWTSHFRDRDEVFLENLPE